MNAGVYINKKYVPDGTEYVKRVKSAFNNCTVVNGAADLNGLDVLFIFGGDGTILSIAADCAKRKIKMIGVNCGHLGFLTEFEKDKLDDAVTLAVSEKFEIQNRNLLSICCELGEFLALNDFVIQRSTSGNHFCNTVNLRAEINGITVDNYASDGVIVSTPTGSTAYSLAAGGSVLTPDISAFIMTPICAHSLHSRPVVYSDSSVLKLYSNDNNPLNIVIDGKVVGEITGKQPVVIKKSDCFASFITKNQSDFFTKLLMKLNIWSK